MIFRMHGDDGEVAATGFVRPMAAGRYVLPKSGADRRRAARVEHLASVVLSRPTGASAGVQTSVMLRDYSRTGMGVLHRRPLGLAERYVLRAGDGSAAVGCEVVRCLPAGPVAPVGGEWFVAGLEFLGPVTAELLRQWLAFAAPVGMLPERWDGMG